MSEEDYSKREIDGFMEQIHTKLDSILTQTTKTNGRVTRLEKIILISATVLTVLLVTNGSELLQVFNILI